MHSLIIHFIQKGGRRSARAKKNIVGIFFLKGFSIIVSLFAVPLTIGYVSPFQYGVWLTISSLVSWLSFFDIGLGSGLKNRFIEVVSQGKKKLAKIYVSTIYALLSILMTIAWVIAAITSFFIDWGKVLNVSSDISGDILFVVLVVLTNFCFQFILRLVVTLLNALQKPIYAALFDAITQVLLVLIILLLTHTTDGSLLNLSVALFASTFFVLLIGNFWAFSHVLCDYRPRIKYVKFSFAKGIFSLSLKFFFLQIIAILFYQTNNIIITQLLGPNEVTVYNIAYKYMFFMPMIFTIVLSPFWSAFAEANTVGDYIWMSGATRKLRLCFGLMAILGLLMFAFSGLFYKLWIGNTVIIPTILTFLMYFYHLANMWGTLHTQLLAGFGRIKLQLILSTLSSIFTIPLSFFLCKIVGLEGLLLGNIFGLIIFNSWLGYVQINKLLNGKAHGIWNK